MNRHLLQYSYRQEFISLLLLFLYCGIIQQQSLSRLEPELSLDMIACLKVFSIAFCLLAVSKIASTVRS